MNIAIIGGGAAGLMTAATIIETVTLPYTLHIYEKNASLGAKVIISGGGRCNVTTGITNIKALKKKYIRGAEFLDHALKTFTPRSIWKRFESHGVPLKLQADNRVFPLSDNGKDIVRIFEEMIDKNPVITTHFKEPVQSLAPRPDTKIELTTARGVYIYDTVVIATGGNAYSHTGSSGDGYTRATACGHTISPLGPSLNSFHTLETRPHELSGIAFPFATIKNASGDLIIPDFSQKERESEETAVLCTHFGITGPNVFSFAAHIPYISIEKNKPYLIYMIPDGRKKYDDRFAILSPISEEKARFLVNVLSQHVPRRVAETFCNLAEIDKNTAIHSMSKMQRKHICHLLADGFPLHLIQRRAGDEFVTAGGVYTSQVHPKTMQSLICPGLFFAGEVLDVDGLTGGFNLTSSRSTGRVAGIYISSTLLGGEKL